MFKIRNKISLLFFLITSCYVATPPLITSRSSENYWETTIGEVGTGAEVMIMPKGTYARIAPQIISVDYGVYLTFFPKEKSCNELENKPRYNYMTVRFYKMPNGKFDMNKVYITKNGKKYHLQPIQSPNDFTVIPAKITSVGTNSFFWYKVPLFCGSLENAVFEMSGIYSDGKELPPVRFQINLLNPTEM